MSKGKKGRSTAVLAAALLTQRAAIGEAGARMFTPVMAAGQQLPDLALVAELLARRLEAARQPVETNGAGDMRALGAAAELRRALVELHALVAPTLFGKSWAERLKLPEVLPDDAGALEIVARDVAKALKKKKLAKPGVKGMLPIDRDTWLERIKQPLKVLGGKTKKDKPRRARVPAAELGLIVALLDLAGRSEREPGKRAARAKKKKVKKEEAAVHAVSGTP
jgi:hypothetical protein